MDSEEEIIQRQEDRIERRTCEIGPESFPRDEGLCRLVVGFEIAEIKSLFQ